MTATKTDDKVPIEKIDSATRASEPLERDIATRAAGSSTAPFQPPGDVPGQVADPNFPSPPPFFNIYSFTIFLKSPVANDPGLPPDSAAQPSLRVGLAAGFGGVNVRVAAPNVQAAFQAVIGQYGTNLLKLIGPCTSFVGADATLSGAAGASAPMQAKPLQSKSSQQSEKAQQSEKEPQTAPRKSHASWD